MKFKRIKEDLLLVGIVGALALLALGLTNLFGPTVYDRSMDKTVMITVPTIVDEYVLTVDKGGLGVTKQTRTVNVRGSGAFITKYGHVLTCAHLVTAGRPLDINLTNSNGLNSKARILAIDFDRDLMLLKGNFTDTPYFESASTVKVGDPVFAIGNSLGMPFSVSQGIISAVHRNDFLFDMTQTDAAINPGNSGGPLINLDGKLVGINSKLRSPVDAPIFTGLGFAVSADEIKVFLSVFKGLGDF